MESISSAYNNLSKNTRLNLELIVAPIFFAAVAVPATVIALGMIDNFLSTDLTSDSQLSPASQSTQTSPNP